jgi:hypothetical protein
MLTIQETKTILEISYPTALALAQSSGQQVDGRWLIPDGVIASRIATERSRVDKMEQRFRLALAVQVLE